MKAIFSALAVIGSVIILSSCSAVSSSTTATSPGAALPVMPSYSEDFRMQFADEVDEICGNADKGIVGKYINSCIFIQDSIVLRRQLRAISE